MIELQYMQESIKLTIDALNKTDKINQRLVTAIIATVISFCLCFCVTLVGFAYFYFTTNYEYGTVNQSQTNTENSNQNINKGGK